MDGGGLKTVDNELRKNLELMKTKIALVNGSPTSSTFDNTTDSLENIRDELVTATALIDTTETTGPFSYLDAGAEQDVVEDATVVRRHIWLEVSNRNMTQSGLFKLYRKVDGANYDLWSTEQLLASGNRVLDYEFTTNQHWKISYTEDADEGAARSIPYNIITQILE